MSSNRSRSGEAAITVASLLLVFLTLLGVFLLAGDFTRWYANGGVFMHLIVLAVVGQAVAGIGLGLASLKKPRPIYLHLLVPAGTALLGLAGSHFGLSQGIAAVRHAPPDMIIPMWAAVIAISDNTRQFGYLVAGLGCLLLVVIGLATRPRGDEPEQRAAAFSSSLLAALGGVLGVLALGAAWTHRQWAQAHNAIASASPDMKMAMVSYGLDAGRTTLYVTLVGLALAAVAAVALLARDQDGAAPWLAKRAVEGGVVLLLVSVVVGLEVGYDLRIGSHHETLADTALLSVPKAIILPASTSELRISPPKSSHRGDDRTLAELPLVVVTESGVWLKEGAAPLPFDEVSGDRLRAALGSAESVAPPPEAAAKKEEVPKRKLEGRLSGLLGIEEALEVPPACNSGALPLFALAIDESTPMVSINRLHFELRLANACEAQLLTRHADGRYDDIDSPEAAALLAPMRRILELEAAARQPVIELFVEPALRELDPSVSRSESDLRLTARLLGRRIELAGIGGVIERQEPFTLANVQKMLIEIKDSFPADNQLWIEADDRASFADLVALIDLAREVEQPDGERRILFDQVFWGMPEDEGDLGTLAEKLQGLGIGTLGIAGGGASPSERRDRSYSGTLRPGKVAVIGGLSSDAVVRVVMRVYRQIEYCYTKELRRQPELSGQLGMKLVIGATGKVRAVKSSVDTVGSAAVTECVEKIFRRLIFPAPKGGGVVEVDYRFFLQPE